MKRFLIVISSVLVTFFTFLIFCEIVSSKYSNKSFLISGIEERLLAGVKEGADSGYYNNLLKLLKSRDYKALERCLRSSYSFLECKGEKVNKDYRYGNFELLTNFIKERYPYFSFSNNSSFKTIEVDLANIYLRDRFIESGDNKTWSRENSSISRRFFHRGVSPSERLLYPPVVDSLYFNNNEEKIDNKVINILAFSDSFGEGAGNYDSNINWIDKLEYKLNSLGGEYIFKIKKVANIGANYNDYHRWFKANYISNEDPDIILLGFHNNDLQTYGELSKKGNILPKESIRYINCLDKEVFLKEKIFYRFFNDIINTYKLYRCERESREGFLNLYNGSSEIGGYEGDNYIDYKEIKDSYREMAELFDKDIFVFDYNFFINKESVSNNFKSGQLVIDDLFNNMKSYGYKFFDNYKNIDLINSKLYDCFDVGCDGLEANYFDGHYSAPLLNAIIDSNIDKIKEMLVDSYIRNTDKDSFYLKGSEVKILRNDNADIAFNKNIDNIEFVYSAEYAGFREGLDYALCAGLGREYLRIPINPYFVNNKIFDIKFNLVNEDLLFAVGGYDKFGNQVISRFYDVSLYDKFSFNGSLERSVIFIAKKNEGCHKSKWALSDLAFNISYK